MSDNDTPRGPTCKTSLPYDHVDENGHKIAVHPIRSPAADVKEVDLTVMVERPGRRYTSNPEILRIEQELGRENLANPARPVEERPGLDSSSDRNVE